MVSIQRKMAEVDDCILEGRDIGTVVFPNADFKFFLDASLDVRSFRRWNELKLSEKIINFLTEEERAFGYEFGAIIHFLYSWSKGSSAALKNLSLNVNHMYVILLIIMKLRKS